MIHTSVGTITKATSEDYDGQFDLESLEGDGVLMVGKVKRLNNHTLTDSDKKKFRFVQLTVEIKGCSQLWAYDEKMKKRAG